MDPDLQTIEALLLQLCCGFFSFFFFPELYVSMCNYRKIISAVTLLFQLSTPVETIFFYWHIFKEWFPLFQAKIFLCVPTKLLLGWVGAPIWYMNPRISNQENDKLSCVLYFCLEIALWFRNYESDHSYLQIP